MEKKKLHKNEINKKFGKSVLWKIDIKKLIKINQKHNKPHIIIGFYHHRPYYYCGTVHYCVYYYYYCYFFHFAQSTRSKYPIVRFDFGLNTSVTENRRWNRNSSTRIVRRWRALNEEIRQLTDYVGGCSVWQFRESRDRWVWGIVVRFQHLVLA